MLPLPPRLARQVRVSTTHTHKDGTPCWEYTGRTVTRYYRRRRAVYEALVGPIPEGHVLDHLCRNPPCIRPSHQEPVTQAENLRRAPGSLAAINAAKTHCVNGHPLSGEGARVSIGKDSRTGNPVRRCLVCHAAREGARRKRDKTGG